MTGKTLEQHPMPQARDLSRRKLFVTAAALTTVTVGIGTATRVSARDLMSLAAHEGLEVILTGRVVPPASGAGHFLTLLGENGGPDIRVFARDSRFMRPGQNRAIKGRLQLGVFTDIVTGDTASALLLDATLV